MKFFAKIKCVFLPTLFTVTSLFLTENATAQCNLTTINPSFEYPAIPAGTWDPTWRYAMILDNNPLYPITSLGWQTAPVAGGANNHEIEFRTGGAGFPNAHTGTQYIELNADQVSYIYQDFSTTPGFVFTWSFWHCSRGDGGLSPQTCGLEVGPPGGPYVNLYHATSPLNTWKQYTGTYTIPAGQLTTRFRFVSEFSDPIRGNFLDDISFTGSTPAPTVTNPSPYCQNSSAASLSAIGANLLWYTTAVGGIGNSAPPTPDTSIPGSFDYWVTQTIGTCESSTRSKITVTVLPLPTATIAVSAPSTVNIGDASPVITFTGANGTRPYTFTYHINSGGNQTVTTTALSDIATVLAPTTVGGTYTYDLVSVKDNSINMCSNSVAGQMATVTVLPTDPCTVQSINPDFEDAVLPPGATQGFVNQTSVSGWKTTAADGIMEFWRSGNSIAVPPYSGTQFIELNANMVSGIYQDFNTPEPATFNYSFAHRGRLGPDVCGVFAGVPGGPMTQIATASDATTWALHTGKYTIPVGQTTTRFEFRVISSTGGDNSVGNFLDAISFTSTIAPPIAPTNPTYYCQNSTPIAIPVIGSNLLWYTTAIGGVGTSTQPSINTATVGTTAYYVSQTSAAGCESPRDTATITILPLPTATISGTTSVCSGTTSPNITFTGASGIAPYTFSYKINGGTTQTITTTLGNSITIPQATTTANTFKYDLIQVTDASVNSCANVVTLQSATITVTAQTTPIFSAIGPLCQNSVPPTLPATSTNGITGTWAPAIINTTTVGSSIYTFTPNAGQCATSTTLSVSITGTTAPTFTTVPAATLCMNSNAQYTVPAGATTYIWTIPGTLGIDYQTINGSLNTTSNDITIKWLTAGSKTVKVDCGIMGDCYFGSISNLTTITQTPTVNAINNITVCAGDIVPATVLTSIPAVATFNWTNNDGSIGLAAAGTGDIAGFTASNSTASPKVATISIIADNGGCAGVAKTFTITVNPIPSAPTLSAVNNCNGTSNLTASAFTGALLWSTGATTPSISVATAGNYTATQAVLGCVSLNNSVAAAPNNYPPTPTASITYEPTCTIPTGTVVITAPLSASMVFSKDGITYSATTTFANLAPSATYDFYAKDNITGCISQIPQTLTIAAKTPPPSAPIVINNTRCGSGSLTLSATGSDVIKWYSNIALTSHITDGTSYSPNISATTNYYVTTVENTTGCESLASIATATVNPIPSAPTLSVVNNCDGSSDLTATGYTGSLLWSTGATTPSISVATAGNYTATQTILGCVSINSSVAAKPNNYPATPTASITYEPTCTIPTGLAVITAPLSASMVFSKDGVTYLASTSFANLTPSTTYDFYAKDNITGCISQIPRSLTIAAKTPPPSAPIVINDTRCGSGQLNLSATGSDAIKWYADVALISHLADGTSYSPNISATTNYYVTTVENTTGCESLATMATATVNPIPSAPIVTTPIDYCLNDAATLLSAQGVNLSWYNSANATPSSSPILPTTTNVGPNQYFVTQTVNSCESPKEVIDVITHDLPEVNIVLDSIFIYPKTSQTIEAFSNGDLPLSYSWTPQEALSNDTILNPVINATTNPNLNTDYQLVVKSRYGCLSSDKVYVAVLQEIVPPNVFSPNNDGINDTWKIENIDQYPQAHVSIFNRYGQFIYDKIGYISEWDGTYQGSPLPIDAYFWIIKLQKEGAIMQGTISIIR